jgi:hypothetical protein
MIFLPHTSKCGNYRPVSPCLNTPKRFLHIELETNELPFCYLILITLDFLKFFCTSSFHLWIINVLTLPFQFLFIGGCSGGVALLNLACVLLEILLRSQIYCLGLEVWFKQIHCIGTEIALETGWENLWKSSTNHAIEQLFPTSKFSIIDKNAETEYPKQQQLPTKEVAG